MQSDTELAEMLSEQYDQEIREKSPSPTEAPPRYSQVIAGSIAQEDRRTRSTSSLLDTYALGDAKRVAEYQVVSRVRGRISHTGAVQHERVGRSRLMSDRRRPIRAKEYEQVLRWLAGRRDSGAVVASRVE